MARGFYSVIQYVPNRFRAESVNIGLVLMRAEPHALRVRVTDKFDRARRLFRLNEGELKNLQVSALSFKNRIESNPHEFETAEDMAAFAAARANDLRLTHPRLAVLQDIDADFEQLFSQLVGELINSAELDTPP